MKKIDEMITEGSCFNKADWQERLFVLLARDAAAPVAIRAWIAERLRLGKNDPNDDQIIEAMDCADLMEQERLTLKPLIIVDDRNNNPGYSSWKDI